MINLLGKIPNNDFVIACSGGPDSMALAHFCMQGKKKFDIAFVHHNTEASDAGFETVASWCKEYSIPFSFHRILTPPAKRQSKEEFWRNERYQFFQSFNKLTLMAHHLDDVIETWIFSSLNGNPYLIPYKNHKRNIIRPFLLNEKEKLVKWCDRNNVPYILDQSNKDVSFARNRIRHNIVPEALKINPGLHKVLRKKILAEHKMLEE